MSNFSPQNWKGNLKSFYMANINLIPKVRPGNYRKENHRSIFVMNKNAKILNKIQANRIHKHIKRIIHQDQVRSLPEMQGWLSTCESISMIHHINRVKYKTNAIINIWIENIWKNATFFSMIKTSTNWVQQKHTAT